MGEWRMGEPGDSSFADSLIRHLPGAALAGILLAVATLAGHIQATLFIILALAIYTGAVALAES